VIINIRGTSGSGKSSLVRRIMGLFTMEEVMKPPRRKPIGYHGVNDNGVTLWTVGHYETDCGGCDTIVSLDEVYSEVRDAADKGFNVLYEGIMASGEFRRCVQLYRDGYKVHAIALDTPMTDCLKAIQERRDARGDIRPFDPTRTIRRSREVSSMMEHLRVCHVPTQWLTRQEAFNTVKQMLGVT
jgi:hypothetical protein